MADAETKIVPEWIPIVKEFQRLFSPYFPHLADDLDLAGFEMSWLHTRVLGNPLDTVRKSQAKRDLAKIRAMVLELSRMDLSYWLPLNASLFIAKEKGDDDAARADELFKFFLALNEWHEGGDVHRTLDRFIREAEQAIDAMPEAGNVNWEAVHAVDGLRTLWWRNTGEEGPARALNPASRFASYLRDGFDYLEIEADPVSAFKRWAAKVGPSE